jgi:peptide/nickel transport system permease protein
MLRYILRRVLQMIPTVLGVILVTFILFNVVGGSQARVVLGEHASTRTLEEYDEVRGFNRPLLFGWWTTTRALEDSGFDGGAGVWKGMEGVLYRLPEGSLPGRIGLPPGRSYSVPFALPLRDDTDYRFTLVYRTAPGSESAAVVSSGSPPGPDEPATTSEVHRVALAATHQWKTVHVPVVPGAPGFSPSLHFEVEKTDIEIREVRLRRKMPSPFHSQFIFYLGQIARLDFGESSSTNQKVSHMLREGIVPSLTLTVPIFVVGLVVAVSLSLVCAFFRNRFIDRFFVVLSVGLMSINYLIFIIVGQYLLAFKWEWFPVWGYESWRYLLLPVVIGVVSGLGANVRFYRTVVLDEMYRDYVRTAFAKGVSKRSVLFRHVLKNAMVPILTNVVIAIPFLYTGSLLLESFFGIPGLGYLAINAIHSADIDVIRAIVLIGSILFVVANLITDLSYAVVDPRVKFQ